jgi:large subunit ribosomal protein L4
MELVVYKFTGEPTDRKITLKEEIFGIEPNDHAIYLDVKQIQANQRQGTHKSKDRSEVSGSTRKLKRQKGTGGARAGDINSPLFVGGGRVFGPRPRDYGFKLNKKTKRLARMSALAHKALENSVMVIEDFTIDAPKTKTYADFLKRFSLQDKKTLLVVTESNNSVILSARNLKNAKVINASDLNTYDILSANNLVFVESSLQVMDQIYAI